jgi:hypothetical protein
MTATVQVHSHVPSTPLAGLTRPSPSLPHRKIRLSMATMHQVSSLSGRSMSKHLLASHTTQPSLPSRLLYHLWVRHQVACVCSLAKMAHVRHVVQGTSLGALAARSGREGRDIMSAHHARLAAIEVNKAG